jgi:hypothetical protein
MRKHSVWLSRLKLTGLRGSKRFRLRSCRKTRTFGQVSTRQRWSAPACITREKAALSWPDGPLARFCSCNPYSHLPRVSMRELRGEH